jgi:hypothetical protein
MRFVFLLFFMSTLSIRCAPERLTDSMRLQYADDFGTGGGDYSGETASYSQDTSSYSYSGTSGDTSLDTDYGTTTEDGTSTDDESVSNVPKKPTPLRVPDKSSKTLSKTLSKTSSKTSNKDVLKIINSVAKTAKAISKIVKDSNPKPVKERASKPKIQPVKQKRKNTVKKHKPVKVSVKKSKPSKIQITRHNKKPTKHLRA